MELPITLIGFMGSGKTTIGKQMAREKGKEFLDLDKYIEEASGLSIPEIFQTQGEEGFREIESRCLKEVLEIPGQVIALGGGTPCYMNNIEVIKAFSKSIYLKISPEGLAGRLLKSANPRPLIEGKDPGDLLKYIQDELEKREKYYLQADYVIESDQIQVEDLLSLILV